VHDDVCVEISIGAPPDEVWAALTTPKALKAFFFGAEVITDWVVGHQIRFRGEWKGKTYEDKGTILAFEPGRRLAYSHWSPMSGDADIPENFHYVWFDLHPSGNGTRVELRQSHTPGGRQPSAAARAEFTNNWTRVLAGLKETVERR